MSSIVSPRRTDRQSLPQFLSSPHLPTAIASVLLAMLMISFQPFQPAGSGETGGNIVNQLGYGSLGAISILALVVYATPRVMSALFSPSFLLLIALAMLSVFNAADPPSAMRAMAFTLIGIVTMAAALSIPRDADAFSRAIEVAGFVVLALCYVGLVLFPNEAKHTADSMEPEHAGLWRGVFTHKNVAAPVMACLSFSGLYLMRRGRKLPGAILFGLAMFFMLHTGSKTTAGLVPVAMIAVALPGLFGMRPLTALLFWLSVAGTALGTLGVVFIEPLREFVAWNYPELTFTGRTTLWRFAGEMIMQKPWTGYGFESFWGTPFMETVSKPFDAEWDIRGIVHGHNGYLDVAIPMGLPALGVAVWALLVSPVIDYLRVPRLRENVLMGDLFMMILMFTALNAFLESFFFRRADPVWLFFVFALMGLRLVARFPVTGRRPAQ
ncbi:O-antigen ligase family protein [Pseudaminobacter sp. 19-2017]|uniref:O-antigen ligase family protein n=1 Tax=Pseudaminobacter soli (ex Zhang et al. 2022) TaxID=2831468 RepID=A0A942I7M2_9HYPH|nr:O-antigen ligase [Pseudaminobacter soli]MBS3648530.1 O-antigen ligase family protein [Pseudaminobacter soli]